MAQLLQGIVLRGNHGHLVGYDGVLLCNDGVLLCNDITQPVYHTGARFSGNIPAVNAPIRLCQLLYVLILRHCR